MTAKTDPLSGLDDADAKIEWARSQRAQLANLTQAYLDKRPWRTWSEADTARGGRVMKIQVSEPPPRIVTAHVGMMLQACRSALDYAAITLAKRDEVKKLREVYFPITPDQAAFGLAAAKKLKGFSASSTSLVESFQPYVTGSHWLRLLNGLNIDDKHNRLLRAAAITAGVGLTNGFGPVKIGGAVDTWGPIDEARTVLWCGPNAQWEFNIYMQLGLTEPNTDHAKSLTDTFDVIADEASKIIDATRAHLS